MSCSGSTLMLTSRMLVSASLDWSAFNCAEIRGQEVGQRVNVKAAIQTSSARSRLPNGRPERSTSVKSPMGTGCDCNCSPAGASADAAGRSPTVARQTATEARMVPVTMAIPSW